MACVDSNGGIRKSLDLHGHTSSRARNPDNAASLQAESKGLDLLCLLSLIISLAGFATTAYVSECLHGAACSGLLVKTTNTVQFRDLLSTEPLGLA